MKLLITAAGTAAAAALAIVAATASGQSTSSTTTIKLVEHEQHFQFIDVAPLGGAAKPPSQGDEFVIGGRLTKAGGGSAGTSNLVCTITQPGSKGLSECVGTLALPAGTISIQGISRLVTEGDSFAVSGGTGRYASATGVVVSSQGKNSTENITVRLD